jgi:integrase
MKKTGLYMISYVDGQGLKRSALTPYSLRAGFGSFVFQKTKDIKITSIALRHRDLQMRTTLKYVLVNEAEIRQEIFQNLFS